MGHLAGYSWRTRFFSAGKVISTDDQNEDMSLCYQTVKKTPQIGGIHRNTLDGLAFKVDWQLLMRCLHMYTCLPIERKHPLF